MKNIKIKQIITTIMLFALSLLILVGCNKTENEVKIYNVTFDFGYNYKMESVLVNSGDCVISPKIELREGYKFLNWKCNGETFDLSSTPITSDIVLTADWLKLKPIYVVVDGVSTLYYIEPKNSYTLNDFTDIVPTKEGQELSWFYKIVDGDIVSVDLSSGLDANMTIYADFNSIGLTFSKCDNLDEMQIDGYNLDATDIVIPNFYNNLPVTTIGIRAFNQKTIKTIAFNKKIDTIKEGAFSQITMDVITIPKTVVTIGKNAFANSKLYEINFEEGSKLTELGECAFGFMVNLISVILPNNLQAIKIGTFHSCSKLSEIYIPNSVLEISNNIFFGCSQLNDIYRQNLNPNLEDKYVVGLQWNYDYDRPINVKYINDYTEMA